MRLFWRKVEPEPAFDLVPVPAPVTVADVAPAKSEGPIIPSQQLLLQLRGWTGNAPPKPWTYRCAENELAYRAKLREARAGGSGGSR